jgi:hypothetical protein
MLQMNGDHAISFSTLRLPGLIATNYLVTCNSRPQVPLYERERLGDHLTLSLAEDAADALQNKSPRRRAVEVGNSAQLTALWTISSCVFGTWP